MSRMNRDITSDAMEYMRNDHPTNGEQSMKLWTWHTSDFDISRDRVDLSRSYYHENAEGIPQKYEHVFDRLKTRDIVWCFTVETPWASNQTSANHRVRWTLNAPVSGILCCVDELLAHRLQGNTPCPDIATWRCWRREAVGEHPMRIDRQEKFIEAKLRGYTGQWLNSEEGWRGFFLNEPETAEHVSALLGCPIDPMWIKENMKGA